MSSIYRRDSDQLPPDDRCVTGRRAHERITALEEHMQKHQSEHEVFEKALSAVSARAKEIADDTKEIVQAVKGLKALHDLIVWAKPIVLAAAAVVVTSGAVYTWVTLWVALQ